LKKSLIGQSEVLVICGTALMLSEVGTWGAALIVMGLLGSIIRFAISFQLLHEEKELRQQGIDYAYEKAVTTILSETAQS